MSFEADLRRDTANLTPTRFLMECGEITPGFGLNLENAYNPFDASCKYLTSNNSNNNNSNNNANNVKVDTDSLNLDNRIAMSTAALQQTWSDMVFDESYLPMRQMTPGISPPSSTSSMSSSASSASSASTQSFYSTARTSPIHSFHPRMMSMTSDQLIPHPEVSHSFTHEYHALYENLIPFKKSSHSDQDLPQLSPDSPSPTSLVPTGIFRNNSITMDDPNLAHDCYPPRHDSDSDDQDMSGADNSDMDVDSNEFNDDRDDQDTVTSPSSQSSRGRSLSVSETPSTRTTRIRASKRVAAAAAASAISSKSDSKPSSKAPLRSKRASKSKAKDAPTTSSTTTSPKKSANKNVDVSKTLSQLRKHSSSEEESPEAKRQKFLERNRMAASKCREKKRLQTLKTIEDADVITARNQALHETLDELQEEVRTLKNLILCHRDCGCDVIQKFVQSSFNVPTIQVQPHLSQSFFKRL